MKTALALVMFLTAACGSDPYQTIQSAIKVSTQNINPSTATVSAWSKDPGVSVYIRFENPRYVVRGATFQTISPMVKNPDSDYGAFVSANGNEVTLHSERLPLATDVIVRGEYAGVEVEKQFVSCVKD